MAWRVHRDSLPRVGRGPRIQAWLPLALRRSWPEALLGMADTIA